jgi:hypothetical protein
MITTPMGPIFVKNNGQSGARSGDHTHGRDGALRCVESTRLDAAVAEPDEPDAE